MLQDREPLKNIIVQPSCRCCEGPAFPMSGLSDDGHSHALQISVRLDISRSLVDRAPVPPADIDANSYSTPCLN